jgi:hypothetical protein
MRFDVYCDENWPDLLSTKKPQANYMVIGSLWLRRDDREEFKKAIHELRDKHKVGGEFKWNKVSASRLDFYKDLITWFIDQGDNLRFRCIAVEQQKINLLKYHENDQELGFYKFYYQMLHHWIDDFNEYSIFCDFKTSKRRDRLPVLASCLSKANLSSTIKNVQATRSRESVLMQLVDVLTGAASARLNNNLNPKSAKDEVVNHIESLLGRDIKHTLKNKKKFNVFVIDLQGGW